MKLREKTILYTGLTILGMIGMMFVVSQTILQTSFAKLEEQNTRLNVERVLSAVSRDFDNRGTLLKDWAEWTDTYEFAQGDYDDYADDLLMDETFINLGLNLMVFTDSTGELIYAKNFDLDSELEVPVPESLTQHLKSGGLLVDHIETDSLITGILELPEGHMLITSNPILTSDSEGPIAGTMIMGRFLDSAEIDRLSETTHLSLDMRRFKDPSLVNDFQSAKSSMLGGESTVIQPVSNDFIAGYTLLNDIYGEPSLLMKVEIPRDIYNQGKKTSFYFIISLLFIGFIFAILTLFLLEKTVLSPMTHLSNNVNNIQVSGDTSDRILVTGDDELSSLANKINGMLEVLTKSGDDLKKSETKYRTLFSSMIEGVALHEIICSDSGEEVDYLITDVNPAFEKILGIKRKDAVGHKASALYEADEPPYLKLYAKVADTGKPTSFQTYFPPMEKHFNIHVFSPGKGKFATVFEDITKSKIAEMNLKKAYSDLQLMDELKSNITANVTHELRTPITIIANAVELAKDEKDLNVRKILMDTASEAVWRQNIVVEDLLEAAKMEYGSNKLTLRQLDLGKLIKHVSNEFKIVIQNKELKLTTQIERNLPMIKGDPLKLSHALRNLINNAIKFSKKGGKIFLKVRKRDKMIEVEISDEGAGIPKNAVNKIFDRFYQADSSTSRNFAGTGLGLSIVKEIINTHSGDIWVESELGKGTTFHFSIPIK